MKSAKNWPPNPSWGWIMPALWLLLCLSTELCLKCVKERKCKSCDAVVKAAGVPGWRGECWENWPHHRHRRDGRLTHLWDLAGPKQNVQVRKKLLHISRYTTPTERKEDLIWFGQNKTFLFVDPAAGTVWPLTLHQDSEMNLFSQLVAIRNGIWTWGKNPQGT